MATEDPNMSYTHGVIELLAEIEEQISENEFCNGPEELKKELNLKSKQVLGYINDFKWTLTGDGQDYRPNTLSKKYMGCAGNLKVNKTTPKNTPCSARSHNYIFPSNFNSPLEAGK